MSQYLRLLTDEDMQMLSTTAPGRAAAELAPTLLRPVDGEALCMPAACRAWDHRAAALVLRGKARERDREAFMQGVLAVLTCAGLMTHDRANALAFMTAVGRLPDYMEAQARKDT